MSNLVNLVRFKTKEMSEQNRQSAYQLCDEADRLIAIGLSSDRGDKDLVKRAISLYKESIDLYSHQVKPYIGLAYIMYSLDELEDSLGLLNNALKIDPYHQQASKMRSIILERHNSSRFVSNMRSENPLSEKLKEKKNANKDSFFTKITSIFIKSIKPKEKGVKKAVMNDFANMINETSQKMDTQPPVKPGVVSKPGIISKPGIVSKPGANVSMKIIGDLKK